MKSVMQIIFLENCYNSLVCRFDEWCSIWWKMNYSDDGMKVVHEWGLAWSTDRQQKNVEWDTLLQEMFLYLWDKVVENKSWKMTCVTQDLGLFFHVIGREPFSMFLGSLSDKLTEASASYCWKLCHQTTELAYPLLPYSLSSTFPPHWYNFGLASSSSIVHIKKLFG